MHIRDFSKANLIRCQSPEGFNHSISKWSLNDWLVATLGELGEAANVAKKIKRIEGSLPGNVAGETEEVLKERLADELADTFIYLDLTCRSAGIDLEKAVIRKFNRTSEKVGYPVTLREGD